MARAPDLGNKLLKVNMDITLKRGLLTEIECQKAFIDLGYSVSIPLGNFDKYDMIVDVDGKLL